MSDFDPVLDTQTSAVLARFDNKGMWDKRHIDKLVLHLLEQRDWHQSETASLDFAYSVLSKKAELMEEICKSYYEWEWGENIEDSHPKAVLLKEWYNTYVKKDR